MASAPAAIRIRAQAFEPLTRIPLPGQTLLSPTHPLRLDMVYD